MNNGVKLFLVILLLLVIWVVFIARLVQIGFPTEYYYGSWIEGQKASNEKCLGKSKENMNRGPEGGFKICYGVVY